MCDTAVREVERLLRAMLQGAPQAVLSGLVGAGCQVAIIGCKQVRVTAQD